MCSASLGSRFLGLKELVAVILILQILYIILTRISTDQWSGTGPNYGSQQSAMPLLISRADSSGYSDKDL